MKISVFLDDQVGHAVARHSAEGITKEPVVCHSAIGTLSVHYA